MVAATAAMALVARKRRRVIGERKAVIVRSRKKTRSGTSAKLPARTVPLSGPLGSLVSTNDAAYRCNDEVRGEVDHGTSHSRHSALALLSEAGSVHLVQV